MMILTEMLSYPFLVRALIAGVLVSLCAALLGTSLVLKSYSMIGDGLSHVGFASLACAYPFGFSPFVHFYSSLRCCRFFTASIEGKLQNQRRCGNGAVCTVFQPDFRCDI